MKYTSKIIEVARNKETIIELPFQANYLYIKLVNKPSFPISLSLDGGEDIVMLGDTFSLDFDFSKITIKVTDDRQNEWVKLLYFFSGKGTAGNTEPTVMEENPLEVTVETKIEALKSLKKSLEELYRAGVK